MCQPRKKFDVKRETFLNALKMALKNTEPTRPKLGIIFDAGLNEMENAIKLKLQLLHNLQNTFTQCYERL